MHKWLGSCLAQSLSGSLKKFDLGLQAEADWQLEVSSTHISQSCDMSPWSKQDLGCVSPFPVKWYFWYSLGIYWTSNRQSSIIHFVNETENCSMYLRIYNYLFKYNIYTNNWNNPSYTFAWVQSFLLKNFVNRHCCQSEPSLALDWLAVGSHVVLSFVSNHRIVLLCSFPFLLINYY